MPKKVKLAFEKLPTCLEADDEDQLDNTSDDSSESSITEDHKHLTDMISNLEAECVTLKTANHLLSEEWDKQKRINKALTEKRNTGNPNGIFGKVLEDQIAKQKSDIAELSYSLKPPIPIQSD